MVHIQALLRIKAGRPQESHVERVGLVVGLCTLAKVSGIYALGLQEGVGPAS